MNYQEDLIIMIKCEILRINCFFSSFLAAHCSNKRATRELQGSSHYFAYLRRTSPALISFSPSLQNDSADGNTQPHSAQIPGSFFPLIFLAFAPSFCGFSSSTLRPLISLFFSFSALFMRSSNTL